MTDGIQAAEITPLEREKLKLERLKIFAEGFKWVVIAVGAVVSFLVLDLGRLTLDESRAQQENERVLLRSYLEASSEPTPELWKRKLRLLETLTSDPRMRVWAEQEREFINRFAALDALYRETISVASQLTDPALVGQQERLEARRRFEQLYWAELPFAGESAEVVSAMVRFRKTLMAAELSGTNSESWTPLNGELIVLAQVLKQAVEALPDLQRPEIP